MPHVLLLTGTCASGKTTLATLIAQQTDYLHIAEDDLWHQRFGKNRGPFGSQEHRRKRQEVHATVQADILAALEQGKNVVIDATVHEAPPEAFLEYRTFFEAHGIAWKLRVLHPRLEVAVLRDAERSTWTIGAAGVAQLHAKFTGAIFGRGCFVDNSDETPEQTVRRLLGGCCITHHSSRQTA